MNEELKEQAKEFCEAENIEHWQEIEVLNKSDINHRIFGLTDLLEKFAQSLIDSGIFSVSAKIAHTEQPDTNVAVISDEEIEEKIMDLVDHLNHHGDEVRALRDIVKWYKEKLKEKS